MTTATPAEPQLSPQTVALIREACDKWNPLYRGLSNHLTMALAAMDHLGASSAEIDAYHAHYAERLEPLDRNSDYFAAYQRFLRDIQTRGIDETLHANVPILISGWWQHAYHPFIRLAYGVRFAIPQEVAAGLAYWTVVGGSDRLASEAAKLRVGNSNPFVAVAEQQHEVEQKQMFAGRFEAALRELDLSVIEVPDKALHVLSREAIDILACTHNFFALHLVTGSHAYAVLYPYAGPDRDAVFTLGLVLGYAALNCPSYSPEWQPLEKAFTPQFSTAIEEHCYKLAFSASDLADKWPDAAWMNASDRYFAEAVTA